MDNLPGTSTEGALIGRPLRVHAVRDGTVQVVEADELRITLPSGVEMTVQDFAVEDDALILHLPNDAPQHGSLVFVVRPGAANTLFLGAEHRPTAAAVGAAGAAGAARAAGAAAPAPVNTEQS